MIHQSQRLLTGLLFTLLLTSNLYGQSSIDSAIVLRVGNVSLTGYELEKNLVLFKDTFRQKNGRLPNNTEIDQWVQTFIDRAYILADAYAKSYDTLPETHRWVSAMARFIISQSGGLLDDKLGGELSEQEKNDAMQKHLRKLHYRYVKFPDYTIALSELGGNSTIKSNKEFEELIKRSSSIPRVSTGEDVVQWPFFQRGEREELILNLREGEISSLITLSDGVYLAQAKKIEMADTTKLPPNFRQVIGSLLTQRKKEQVHQQFYEESIKQAAINYDETFLATIKEHLSTKGSIHSFEKEMFPAIRQRTAITYLLGNTQKQIAADSWMSYYNDLPMRQDIRNENLHTYLEAIVVEDYAFEKAKETGITRDIKFVLDRDNYTKNVVLVIYEREELKQGIAVTDAEIAERYQRTKDSYRQATDAVITALSFPDRRSVSMGVMFMRTGKMDSIVRANAIEAHRSIQYNDALFTDSIRTVIFSLKTNEPSTPLYYKGSWLIIIKESESGNRIQELEEVRSTISKKIEEEKLEQKKKLLIELLKKKYAISNQIDFSNYHIKNQ
jgi:hypothetical protein